MVQLVISFVRFSCRSFPDNNADTSLSGQPVWDNFMNLINVAAMGIEVLSLLSYIFKLAVSTRHGPVLVLLCLGKPLIKFFFRRSLWETGDYKLMVLLAV